MSKWMEINITFEGLEILARYSISIENFNPIDTLKVRTNTSYQNIQSHYSLNFCLDFLMKMLSSKPCRNTIARKQVT